MPLGLLPNIADRQTGGGAAMAKCTTHETNGHTGRPSPDFMFCAHRYFGAWALLQGPSSCRAATLSRPERIMMAIPEPTRSDPARALSRAGATFGQAGAAAIKTGPCIGRALCSQAVSGGYQSRRRSSWLVPFLPGAAVWFGRTERPSVPPCCPDPDALFALFSPALAG